MLYASAEFGLSSIARCWQAAAVFEFALFAVDKSQVAVEVGLIRLKVDCPAVASGRLFQLALQLAGDAEIAVKLGVAGLQGNGPAMAVGRLFQLALFSEDDAEIVVVARHAAVQGDRAADIFDAQLASSGLRSRHAEQMHGVGVVRVDQKNPAIDLLGRLQSASLMMLDSGC